MGRLVAAGRRLTLALLAATIFRLWDGRTIEAVEWIRHGEEYVVTLRDGTALVLRAQEVREVEPAEPRRRPPGAPRPGG